MDTYEFNKIAGAILGTVLLVLVLQNVAGILYHSEHPETAAYSVEVEGAAEGEGGGEAQVEESVPLPQRLAEADADSGAKVARACAACHTFDDGGANGVGPNLYNIVGRQVASVSGYSYSDAMVAKGQEIGTWSFEALDHFLIDPGAYIDGTKMSFKGIGRDNRRSDLLLYLRAQSASPVELPAVEASAPSEDAAASEGSEGGAMDGGSDSGTMESGSDSGTMESGSDSGTMDSGSADTGGSESGAMEGGSESGTTDGGSSDAGGSESSGTESSTE